MSVHIRLAQGRLIVEVTNTTPQLIEPIARSAFGDGLRNVTARLQAAFGDDARVQVGPNGGRGTRAMLDMPASNAMAES